MEQQQKWTAEAEREQMEQENPSGYKALSEFAEFMFNSVWMPEKKTGKRVEMVFSEMD